MVKIKINKESKKIKSFEIVGHANSAEFGKDLICSAITAISTGFMNAIDKLFFEKTLLEAKSGYINIVITKDSEELQLSFQIFYYQLLTIYEQNKKYINWKESEV